MISSINTSNVGSAATIFGNFDVVLVLSALSAVVRWSIDQCHTCVTSKLVQFSLDFGLNGGAMRAVEAVRNFELVGGFVVILVPLAY